jgi:hypothetical protein
MSWVLNDRWILDVGGSLEKIKWRFRYVNGLPRLDIVYSSQYYAERGDCRWMCSGRESLWCLNPGESSLALTLILVLTYQTGNPTRYTVTYRIGDITTGGRLSATTTLRTFVPSCRFFRRWLAHPTFAHTCMMNPRVPVRRYHSCIHGPAITREILIASTTTLA